MKKPLRHRASAYVKGVLRRQADKLLPNRETRDYEQWIAGRLRHRQTLYRNALAPNLLSVITPVWDGSPAGHLRSLARSLTAQNHAGACEWVILDNGCTKKPVLNCLDDLKSHTWVKLHRVEKNLGIAKGLRFCLEHASNRYVLPVDADDCIYRDALKIVTSHIDRAGYPPLLYSDEDKVIGKRFYQPYLKPNWDPVLLLNSAYIAHLQVVDRQKALDLGAYADEQAEGSADWDVFVRFLLDGHAAVHIPEVLYSWRVHEHSTADDAATKPYVYSSQETVLTRFLSALPNREHFTLECSPLLGGAAHWHFVRRPLSPAPVLSIALGRHPGCVDPQTHPHSLREKVRDIAARAGFIHFIGEDVEIDYPDWPWEAQGLFELHPDTVMIGGRIRNRAGMVTDAGRVFGFAGVCGCPDRSRSHLDPGYFAQMFKQRSVSAVSTQFAVIRADFLLDLISNLPQQGISIAFLGAWAGAHALRSGKRVVYTPFLSGISDLDWETLARGSERQSFAKANRDIIPDRRFYSQHLSLVAGYSLADSVAHAAAS